MKIRNFHPGDAPALRAVFYSSVHDLARHHYTAEQLAVWAPRQYDAVQWGECLRGNRPFIAEVDGCIAGFADLQDSGYVDHFFVAGAFAGRGGGRLFADSGTSSSCARPRANQCLHRPIRLLRVVRLLRVGHRQTAFSHQWAQVVVAHIT